MPPPLPLPRYLYKILDILPLSPLPTALPLSPTDTDAGFMHFSTAAQVPATANRFFAHRETLWLLQLPRKKLELVGELKWEGKGDHDPFPHLYGTSIGKDEVERVISKTRGSEGWLSSLEDLEN